MNSPDYNQTKLISNIATDLLSYNATFFIGAGFSRDLGYPSWGELLIDIIDKYSLMEKIKDSSLFYLLPEKDMPINKTINENILKKLIGVDFLRLAGYVDLLLKEEKNKDIRVEIIDIIQRYEDKRKDKDKKEKFDKYKEFFLFIGNYITDLITTNYDTNLEYCIDDLFVVHRNLSSVNSSRTPSKNKNNIKLYKIHGCIKDNDNRIIITEKDYQDFYSSNKYIFHKLYSTLMENNMVFIGYSLADPNIRGLLSEVLEEIKQNKEVQKKIYWINRDMMNDIDKRFYENMYSMQIIDQIEILDFFTTLIELTKTKWNNAKLIEEQWTESTMELLSPSGISTIQFNSIISSTIDAGRYREALNQIYNAFITNSSPRGIACEAFFTILSKIPPTEVQAFEIKTIDILQMNDAHLFHIVELNKKDVDVRNLFSAKGYDKKLLESLILKARTNNAFYQYEYNAKELLGYYGAFNGSLGELEELFIDAFYYNYSYLTNTRTLGYAFKSLKTVEEDLKNFEEEILVKILQRYPTSRKSDVQIEQIEALIATIPTPERQNELRFHFIQEQSIIEVLRNTVRIRLSNILPKEEFKLHWDNNTFDDDTFNGKYQSLTDEGDITFNENENRFSISYKGEVLVIHVKPDFKTGEISVIINNETYNEKPIRIRDLITPIIDESFKNWGLSQ
ncbi:SIR2 family protein [Bacillus atrophaeus]|uniref:SIR2 family NAD-dependent protein deacylase n=1 Tax=Bacillus atrophaeus TaxID=1452 RepID=UPI002E0ACE0F|nr:SIR2 family protein [Bacillus atrophaeus]